MIQLSNSVAQTLQPGQALTFDKVLSTGGCGACWNQQIPNSVKLCDRGNYDITYHANITGTAAGAVQLALALGGFAAPTTAMNAFPAAAGNLWNVSAELPVRNCCCDANRLTVVNSGTTPVTIAPNSALIIRGV